MTLPIDGAQFFECECCSDEHTLKVLVDDEDGHLYTSIFLRQYRNFFGRFWIALKYVFGYKCKYGHFDCFTMKPQDVARMRDLLDLSEKVTKQSAGSLSARSQ